MFEREAGGLALCVCVCSGSSIDVLMVSAGIMLLVDFYSDLRICCVIPQEMIDLL